MRIKRLMQTSVFNSISYPCSIIDVLAELWTGAVNNMLVDVLTIDIRIGVCIVALADMIIDGLEESMRFCWAAFSCWSIALLDCARALQAWMPSYHVWRSFVSPEIAQFLNQEPPRPQQLALPDFWMMPQLEQAKLSIVVVTAGVYM